MKIGFIQNDTPGNYSKVPTHSVRIKTEKIIFFYIVTIYSYLSVK